MFTPARSASATLPIGEPGATRKVRSTMMCGGAKSTTLRRAGSKATTAMSHSPVFASSTSFAIAVYSMILAGTPARIIEYTAIAKLVEDAKTGEWDIAVVAFDPARRSVVDFAPPHIIVDLTFLVAPGSPIGSVAEADRAGVNIAAARGAATTLYLQREFKQAQVVQAENEPAAFNLLKEGKAQVYAQNRYMLLGLADSLPGARVLEDRFSAAEMSIALPKGRPAALAYVSELVEQSKKSGTVQRAIETAKLRGVRVAP